MTLTPKQEAFVLAYAETGNASEAYRRAYNAENMAEATINVKASQFLKQDKIRIRLAALQEKTAKRHEITVDALVEELEAARAAAMKNPKGISAAVSATMGKAKLLGLLVDKTELSGDKNNPLVHKHVSDVDRPPRETRDDWLARQQAGSAASN